jgi:hypothetical protein
MLYGIQYSDDYDIGLQSILNTKCYFQKLPNIIIS